MSQWVPVAGATSVQTYEYSFGPGLARTFAVLGPKGWVVTSPACGGPESMYAALEAQGPVVALVAPNAFHTMGLRAWQDRYPQARLFAPEQSRARVEKKGYVSSVKPVAAAAEFCGDALELIDMPHYKTGEVLVRASTPEGPAWHVTDIIFNWPTLPPGLLPKLVFNILSDSAPGFKLVGPSALLMMRDRRAVYRWMKELALKMPPVRIVPSHGEDVVMDPPGKRLVDLLTTQGKV